MEDDPFEFIFNHRVQLLENQRKFWNSIDTKLSLMLTQAFLFIGFAFNILKGFQLFFIAPIIVSITLYIIGIWPQNQVTMVTPEMLKSMSDYLSKNPKTNMKKFYRSFSCIDNKDLIKELENNMHTNANIIKTKCLIFEFGVIINIIGVVYIVIITFCK